jgi:hypothetical protein
MCIIIEDTKEPKNNWPITCLSTVYKTLTGITAKIISLHFEEQNVLPAEQKGCHSGSKGCKGQLLLSKAIIKDCKNRRTIKHSIDKLSEAFDSVPHSWIEISVELLGVKTKLLNSANHQWRNEAQNLS